MADVKAKAGLEDIVATESSICFIDGDRGVLSYRGYDIHDLARFATFEEVCHLLWHGHLPQKHELGDLQSQLSRQGDDLREPPVRQPGIGRFWRSLDSNPYSASLSLLPSEALASMVRPTRSLVVTIRDIVGAVDGCKMTKRAPPVVQIVGIFALAFCEAAAW